MAELIGLGLIILGIYLFVEYALPFVAAGAGIVAVIIMNRLYGFIFSVQGTFSSAGR